MKKLLTIITITLLFSSCHCIIEETTIIQSVDKSSEKGYYLYRIEAFPVNQVLKSNKKYCVGDTIKLTK